MLRKISEEELKKILYDHKLWLNDKNTGKQAELYGMDLEHVDFSSENLCGARFSGSKLCGANFHNAILCGADFCRSDLRNANFTGAYLKSANFADANLWYARLDNSDLSEAYFSYANLWKATLCDAELQCAVFRNTNLCDVDFFGADLSDTNFECALLYGSSLRFTNGLDLSSRAAASLMVCPEKGSFIGWKKVIDDGGTEYIVELLIPDDAKRSSATSRKCRCSYAIVQSVTKNDKSQEKVQSVINHNFSTETVYEVGKPVYPDSFDDDRWMECSNGIHFFITRVEAVNYRV